MKKENIGEKVFKEYTTGTKNHLTSQVSEIAPDIEKYILNFVFGDIYMHEKG